MCVGGVGFFNKQAPLGCVLPGLFAESHWEPEFGVTVPDLASRRRSTCAEQVVGELPPDRRLFLFVNVSALHQPNWFYLPGATGGRRLARHATPPRWTTSTATSAGCSPR